MRPIKQHLLSPTLAAAVVAFALIVGGVAWAAIPNARGVIYGCYQKNQGQLRVIDTDQGQNCNPAETPLCWNQAGPLAGHRGQ
jgi:hypothetical protein